MTKCCVTLLIVTGVVSGSPVIQTYLQQVDGALRKDAERGAQLYFCGQHREDPTPASTVSHHRVHVATRGRCQPELEMAAAQGSWQGPGSVEATV